MNIEQKAERVLNFVRDAPIIVFDTETTGVDWKHTSPLGYVIATDKESLYIPVRAAGGGNLPDPNPRFKLPTATSDPITQHVFEKELATAFEERNKKGFLIVGHNIKFDAHQAANAGILLGRGLTCTQNNETLLNEYNHGYSLAECAQRHGVEAKKGEKIYQRLAELFDCPVDRKAMAHFWRLSGDDPVAVEYAEGDGITTMQLYLAQFKKLEEEQLGIIAKLESDLIWTLFRMERRGIKIDTSYLTELVEVINQRVYDARQALPADFNIRSPKDIQRYLEEKGRNNWPLTDQGNPSFTESWLKKFPEGRNIVAVRKLTNLINSFIDPLVNEHTFNGRVHANINQLKTDDTGTPARLSCSNPNLTQVPKRDKELATLFRRCYLADDGYEFYEADYSQAEPRMYSHYSKEPALVEGYLKTPYEDVHSIVSKMLNVDREVGKRMNMGLLTGMYPKTFSQHMNWPLDVATQHFNRWHALFPEIRKFQETAKSVLQNRGYVKTILGRRLRLEHPRFAYRGVSKIVQGGQADILKYKLLQIDRLFESYGETAYLLMSVHDSIEFESKETKEGQQLALEAIRVMEDVQSEPFNLRVPFIAEWHKGKNWGEATFPEKNENEDNKLT